ncbi:hypothetical protein BDR26DRAFT_870495 [Obelidium mucronatum]|nr:hypothetical protein BDR26DRAFT_870495 [Obelidium mucronatum]
MDSRRPYLCYSRAVMQHEVELLVLCAGVSVRSVQWLETDTPNAVSIDCDGYVAGNAAMFIDKAEFNKLNRRECALLSLYRLTDAISRLQDINNFDGPRTSHGSLEHLDGYVPAAAPPMLDLACYQRIRSICRVPLTDYLTALLALEESLSHIDRIVLASFETVKQAKYFNVIVDANPNFEASVKSLAGIPELSNPVSSAPMVATAAFVRTMKGFASLVCFADAISNKTPDSFLKYTNTFFGVIEFFRASRDSRPDFTLEIYNHTRPIKKWMEQKIEMGAVYEFFDYTLDCQGKDPADMVGANVVVRFKDKTTLRGIVAVEIGEGWAFKLVFRFEIAECFPADFGWKHVYPAGYEGLKIHQ